ncbi:MAG: sirohydrochlorin chelatase [Pirellulaceae bacterium]
MASQSDSLASHARTGVLLVGHGTRSELGRRQCRALGDEIAAGLDPRLFATELAYLEMAAPTIDDGVARLVKQEVQRLVVVPLLLFAAGHAKDDIPAAVRNALAAAGRPDLPMVQTEPLGLQEPVIELAAHRFRDAANPQIDPQDTCLLLIGRGSRDASATADMRQLGELLHQRLGNGQTQVGFLAMAKPSAQDIIRAAAASPFRQIVVQPHLLFHGELLDRLEQDFSAAATVAPEKTWRMSGVLGQEGGPLAQILRQAILLAGNKL